MPTNASVKTSERATTAVGALSVVGNSICERRIAVSMRSAPPTRVNVVATSGLAVRADAGTADAPKATVTASAATAKVRVVNLRTMYPPSPCQVIVRPGRAELYGTAHPARTPRRANNHKDFSTLWTQGPALPRSSPCAHAFRGEGSYS